VPVDVKDDAGGRVTQLGLDRLDARSLGDQRRAGVPQGRTVVGPRAGQRREGPA
jgi:hypothetical protein